MKPLYVVGCLTRKKVPQLNAGKGQSGVGGRNQRLVQNPTVTSLPQLRSFTSATAIQLLPLSNHSSTPGFLAMCGDPNQEGFATHPICRVLVRTGNMLPRRVDLFHLQRLEMKSGRWVTCSQTCFLPSGRLRSEPHPAAACGAADSRAGAHERCCEFLESAVVGCTAGGKLFT